MNSLACKISVIIPLHNGEQFIRLALASVGDQNLRPHEVIVVDDGSSDGGPELITCLSLVQPLTLLSKTHGGKADACNFGVAHATGDLIAILGQEDIWYPSHLNELSQPFAIEQPIPLGWTYSNLDEIDEARRLVKRGALSATKSLHPKEDLRDCLNQDMLISPSASIINKRALDAVGGFDKDLSIYWEDDLFVRLFSAGYQNIYLEQPLSQSPIYQRGDTSSETAAKSRMIYACKLIPSRLRQCLPAVPVVEVASF